MEFNLHEAEETLQQAMQKLQEESIIDRIWARDHSVWRDDPTEISNRLGWLDVADRYIAEIGRLKEFASEVWADGLRQAVVLGMGGSSLAPDVLAKAFGAAGKGLALKILDSTDPGAVSELASSVDPAKTLYIVSTKSGSTVETLSFFKYFYSFSVKNLGAENAGKHFIAITDPGSRLVDLAATYGFRKVFLNDPEIGGRYSALSFVGLVPAALLGLDLKELLERAIRAAAEARRNDSRAARLGAVMGVLAARGRDKMTLVASRQVESIGDWIEQLVAESTGKEGKGILPVVGESFGRPEDYGHDRLFAGILLGDDPEVAARLDAAEAAGHPVVRLQMADRYDLGAQFFLWEFATAVAGHVLDIQPFDQPDVESAKVQARRMSDAYQQTGELPEAEEAEPTYENLMGFLDGIRPGEYVAIQAFVKPDPDTEAALQSFREAVRARTNCAVTVGFGPRFLHSTGQLHKGDGGSGRFIQFAPPSKNDLPIPDEAGTWDSQMTFDVLKRSQALGDFQALLEANPPRRAIRIRTGEQVTRVLLELAAELSDRA